MACVEASMDGILSSMSLGMLFYRYISENLTSYINKDEHSSGNLRFDYSSISDQEAEQARADMIKTKGFFILPSELFVNLHSRAKDDQNLNITLATIFKNIEDSTLGTDSENNFKGLFSDFNANSPKLGETVEKRNKNLVKLINGVADMKTGRLSGQHD
jgi:type I restriction enzyme M protein